MTIQMLATWNGLEEESIYTLAPAEETRLIGLGLARAYTAGMDGVSDGSGTGQSSVSGGGVRYAAEWGIANDPTLTVDQRPKILQMIADLTADNYGGALHWPAGDICFTAPIDFSGCGSTSGVYTQSGKPRITPPKFVGASGLNTRLRVLGAPANTTAFVFSVTDAQAASGVIRVEAPEFENIVFIGPGNSCAKTTLAADAAAGVALTLNNAVAIGDAVCLSNGAEQHWFTALQAGTSLTLDSRQALLRTWPAATTVVTVFKQSRAIQFGGTRTTGSTITQSVKLTNVRFQDFFAGVFCDDVTIFVANEPVFQNVVHGVQYGCNCDTFTYNTPYLGTDRPLLTANCTNGSNTVFVTANSGTVRVGEKIYEKANNDGSLNFPEHTRITAISEDGATLTLSDAYAGTTGSKTLICVQGLLVAAGQGGSAAIGAYPPNALNNLTATVITNPIAGRVEQLIRCADGVGLGWQIFGGYVEACQRIITNGQRGGSGSGGPFLVAGLVVQGAEDMTGPPLEDFLGGSSRWDIKIIGIGNAKFPLFQVVSYSQPQIRLREGWIWNNTSTAALGFGQKAPRIVNLSVSDPNTAVNIPVGAEWAWNCGALGRASNGGSIISGAHSGAWNWNWPGVNHIDLTLTGNMSGGTIIYGLPPVGYELTFTLTQDATGGRTAALSAEFVDSAGAAISLPAGAANKRLMMRFVSNGTKLVHQGPLPAWL